MWLLSHVLADRHRTQPFRQATQVPQPCTCLHPQYSAVLQQCACCVVLSPVACLCCAARLAVNSCKWWCPRRAPLGWLPRCVASTLLPCSTCLPAVVLMVALSLQGSPGSAGLARTFTQTGTTLNSTARSSVVGSPIRSSKLYRQSLRGGLPSLGSTSNLSPAASRVGSPAIGLLT